MRETEHGATMVEAAMCLPVFLLVLIAGVECIRIAFVAVSTQFVAAAAVRAAVVGGSAPAVVRAAAIEAQIITQARILGYTLQPGEICIARGIAPSCAGLDDAGEPGQLITIRIRYPVTTMFRLGSFVITGLAVGRNEPFPTG